MTHPDVFISYSEHDNLVAQAIAASLEESNIVCWLAPRDVPYGANEHDAKLDAISGARIMVLVFSSHSNDSPSVWREAEQAVNAELAIVPFRIHDVPLSRAMEYFISTTHWFDALSHPIEQHLPQLAEVLHSLLQSLPAKQEKVKAAAPTTAQRVEWDSDILSRIEDTLVKRMGPFARVLIRQTSQTTMSLHELLHQLAQHIPNPQERYGFLHECSQSGLLPKRSLTPDWKAQQPPAANVAMQDVIPTRGDLNAETLEQAEQKLALYIGPLAKILVKKAARKVSCEDEFYASLAEHIPTAHEKAQFLASRPR
jgi:hypothetical protein